MRHRRPSPIGVLPPCLGLASCLAAGLIAGLAAAPPAPAEEELRTKAHHGKIVAYDRAEDVLRVRTRLGVHRFDLSPRARVYSDDGEVGIDALAVGQVVTLRAQDDQARQWRTSFVQIVDAAELVGQLEELPAAEAADTATVRSVDPEHGLLTVATPSGARRYRVDAKTQIWRGGRQVEVGALEPDERVAVTIAPDEAEPAEGGSDLPRATHVVVVVDPS